MGRILALHAADQDLIPGTPKSVLHSLCPTKSNLTELDLTELDPALLKIKMTPGFQCINLQLSFGRQGVAHGRVQESLPAGLHDMHIVPGFKSLQ